MNTDGVSLMTMSAARRGKRSRRVGAIPAYAVILIGPANAPVPQTAQFTAKIFRSLF
jgi:hypothetical protein